MGGDLDDLLSGLPVRDYRAEVMLRPAGRGTDIRWRSTFSRSAGRLLGRKPPRRG